MNLNKKQKILLFVFIPTIIALSVVFSIIIWSNSIRYALWIIAIIWGLAIIMIDVVLFLNSKVTKEKVNKVAVEEIKEEDSCITDISEPEIQQEEIVLISMNPAPIIGDNVSDINVDKKAEDEVSSEEFKSIEAEVEVKKPAKKVKKEVAEDNKKEAPKANKKIKKTIEEAPSNKVETKPKKR